MEFRSSNLTKRCFSNKKSSQPERTGGESSLFISVSFSDIFFSFIFLFLDRGFDFDGAAGHDILVTDKLVNRLQSAIQNQLF